MIIKLSFLKFIIPDFFGVEFGVLKNGKGIESNRYDYQREFVKFPNLKDKKVLDIGSGGYPFPFATHLVDLYPNSTTHRTENLVRNGKQFIIADIEKLPFKDKEFDFSYCSHLLEHVDNPAKACEEIMRVSKRGYIETPTKTSDIMFNFLRLKNHHKWFVVASGNTLFFFGYSQEERKDTGINYFYDSFHSDFENPFQKLMKGNRKLFNNMFLWEKRFNYCVVDETGNIVSSNFVKNSLK